MGTIRDFSYVVKNGLENAIEEVMNHRSGSVVHVCDHKGNYYKDLPDYYYHLTDKHNTTKDQLNVIWRTVYNVENEFCRQIRATLEYAQAMKASLTGLADMLAPSAANGTIPLTLPGSEFREQLNALSQLFLGTAVPLVTYDATGKAQYNWKNIEALLHKDPEDITAVEYATLLRVIESMTTEDAKGNVVTDTDALAKFIQYGYSRNPAGPHTVTPAFQIVSALYVEQTQWSMQEYGSVFFNGLEDDATLTARARLREGEFKASLLIEMATNRSIVGLRGIPAPSLSIDIIRDQAGYRVTSDLFDDITVHDFSSNNQDDLLDNIKKNANSLRRNMRQEFTKDLGNFAIDQIIGLATNNPAGVAINAGVFTVREILKAQEIDPNNATVNEIVRDTDLIRWLEAFQISTTITESQGVVTLGSMYFNERELQIALNAYNNSRPDVLPDVTLTQLKDGFSSISQDKNYEDNYYDAKQYLDWYEGEPNIDGYRAKLSRLLTDYHTENPDSPYRALEDLNAEQIIELDKKYDDPDYDLNL
jgi:hypothetical protein